MALRIRLVSEGRPRSVLRKAGLWSTVLWWEEEEDEYGNLARMGMSGSWE